MDITQCLQKIEEEGFPVFRRTLEFISSLENSQEPVPKLAEKILGDPGMAIKLIQIANSPFFNPGDRVKTVTRAIMLLGLQNVKGIALGLALLDDLIKKGRRKRISELFVRSLARAIMARNLGSAIRCPYPEEIYISGLLYDIGELALELLIDPDVLEEIEEKAKRNGQNLEIVQKEELGFSVKDLSREITSKWKLSSILERFFAGDVSSPEILCVKVACELTKKHFFKKEILTSKSEEHINDILNAFEKEFTQFEKSLRLKQEKLKEITKESVREVQNMLAHFLPVLVTHEYDSESIPTSETILDTSKTDETEEQDILLDEKRSEIDFRLFVNISNDIVSLIHSGFKDLNAFFSLAMELIYKGLNMDVVLLLLLTPDKKSCFVRHSFIRPGVRALLLPEKIPLNEPKPHLFSHLMNTTDPIWINKAIPNDIAELIKHPLISSFVNIPCCVAPINVKKQTIGFLYADSRNSLEEITEEHFTGFGIVSRLTSIGLTMFTLQKTGG
ncbi:MAG: HDOD domain-containing protein [Thermodesulforhabdaceae bacterium]